MFSSFIDDVAIDGVSGSVRRHETTPMIIGSLLLLMALLVMASVDPMLHSTLDTVDIAGLVEHSIDNVHFCSVAG